MITGTLGRCFVGSLALVVSAPAVFAGCAPETRTFNVGVGSGGGEGGAGGSSSSGGGEGGAGQGGAGGQSAGGKAALPAPPDASNFAWQSVQTRFLNEASQPCEGLIAMAVGDQVVCYRAADKALRCAGRVYMTTFGAEFVDAGLSGVEQVLFSSTSNSPTGNTMCVKLEDGTARCMGDGTDQGQFGNGSTAPTDMFVQFGSLTDIHRIASGTADQLCAISKTGVVHCAGYNFGATPAAQDGGAQHTTLWVDTTGMARLDDPTVWRAETGRTQCQITSAGLECALGFGFNPIGPPGEVVDGTGGEVNSGKYRACALTSAGKVTCVIKDQATMSETPVEMFTTGAVLAIAGNAYTDSLCAVYSDGSIWCVGSNDQGKLGTGTMTALQAETMVQPPGSVDTSCQ